MTLFLMELSKHHVLKLIYLLASTVYTACHDNCIGESMDNMEMHSINCIISTFRSELMELTHKHTGKQANTCTDMS